MFSFNNHTNTNHGDHPLSLYLSPLLNHDEGNIPTAYIHHHQPNLLPHDPLMAAPHHQFYYPTMRRGPDTSMVTVKKGYEQNLLNSGCPEVELIREMKKPIKKDRHSKIRTAQGIRDRRVRLSIGISRQFFDLQDMLGFDKASKTLECLLKKSRKAIREVVCTKKLKKSRNNEEECYGNNGCEEAKEVHDDGDDDDDDDKYSEEKGVAENKTGSRAEAVMEISKPQIMEPMRSTNANEDMGGSLFDLPVDESIFIGRKMKPSTTFGSSYDQHIGEAMFNDPSSSSNITILPQIWDIYDENPFVGSPFNAFTNMNTSTGP